MSKRIIVLSDGTWETVGPAQIFTITDAAHDMLLDGGEVRDLKQNTDIISTEEIG